MPHPDHAKITAPLTLDNRHPEQNSLRWNPLFGTYVNISTAEKDLTCQIQEENLKAHQRALDKVMEREGELDPIFWRDRKTGLTNPRQPKIIPSKRPVSGDSGIIPAHAKDEVSELMSSEFNAEGEEGEFVVYEEEGDTENNENEKNGKNIKKKSRGFVKTGIDGLPLSPSKQKKEPISDHRNRDHVNVLLHDDMRESISNSETVTFDCTAKALRKRRDSNHIDHVKSLIHQIKNDNATYKECGEAPQRFKRFNKIGHLSRQGTVSSLLHIEDNAPLPPDRYVYDSHGNRHFISAVEEEKWKSQDRNCENVYNPQQYDNDNATVINNSYISKRQVKNVDPRVISSNTAEGFKPILFYDAPPTRKNEEVAAVVNRIPARGKSNRPGDSIAPIPTSRDSVSTTLSASNVNEGVSNTSDHVIFGGQNSANINEEHSAKHSYRKVMNNCKKDSSKDWYVHHEVKDSQPGAFNNRSSKSSFSYMKSVNAQGLEDARLMYEKSLDPNAIDNENLIGKFDRHDGINEVGGHDAINFQQEINTTKREEQVGQLDEKTGNMVGRYDRHDGILEVGGKDQVVIQDLGTEINIKNAEHNSNYVQRRPSWMDHEKNQVAFDLKQANYTPIATPRPAWFDHEACISKKE